MLTLNDGRNELWQWDTWRTLSVDADCSQVHFSNKVFGRSIDVDVVDGVATIPDILLQTDKELNVWAFVGTAENGYTKISKTFKVNRRNKPADYVFTPPDQTSLEEIKEKVEYLESVQDPDAIKNAVDDYLANNPIMVKETDPTVPEWAKQPTPPDVKIPDKLPNPHSITFTGAVDASYDGSNPVEIKIPDSGGNVAYDEAQNLTEEQKAQARENIGAQPAGNYLTEVPEGYAKKTDIPSLDGYAKTTDIPSLDGYAKTEDVPTEQEIIQLIEEHAPESSGGGITVTGAKVGQTVKISAVDENGVPTAWLPTDFPSGGGGGAERMRFIAKITTEEDLKSFEISEDSEGKPFALNRVAIHMKLQGANGNNANVYPTANGSSAVSLSTSISGTAKQNFQVMLETLADGNYVAFKTYPIIKDYGSVELGIPFSTSGKSGGYITSVGFMTYQSVLSGAEIAIWGC